jgi:hypothetical protein
MEEDNQDLFNKFGEPNCITESNIIFNLFSNEEMKKQ